MQIAPLDEHNRELLASTHPADWPSPPGDGRYNLVVVGGGTAGLVSAVGAALLGGRAALVEEHFLGGDCLNFGCVPSKAVIRSARVIHQLGQGHEYGFRLSGEPEIDFGAVMERMRRLRARISRHDSAERLRSLGVDVFLGRGVFISHDTLNVDGKQLKFRRAVIATGSRPAVPPVEGLAEAGYLTNESVFSLTELPRRLIVLGGGPVGCELAQAFRRFGSEVHLVDRNESLLHREARAARMAIEKQFQHEGLHLHLGWTTLAAEKMGDSKGLVVERQGEKKKLIAEAILVASGRRANTAGLGLEAAGVRYNERGVEVNDRLQTSNRAIFAAGDVSTHYRFTHAADSMARICLANALFFGRRKFSSLVIPHCTYTDPEVAHVGLSEDEARQKEIPIDSYRVDLAEVDRAVVDGEDDGFALVHTRQGSGRIVGATVVAAHAGELIAEIAAAMTNKLSLWALARTIHCYPTQSEVFKRIADDYSRTRLTPFLARLARRWLAWRR